MGCCSCGICGTERRLAGLPQVSLIDFTTSRLVTEDGRLAFCDLSQDPEVFQGTVGDIQASARALSV